MKKIKKVKKIKKKQMELFTCKSWFLYLPL